MIGNLLHRQDRFADAMTCYERAHQALLPLGDADGLLSVIHNKAVTLTSLNDFHAARAAYEEARQLAAARGLDQAVGQADYNIAWLYYLRGEYSRAIELLHAAAALASRYHATARSGTLRRHLIGVPARISHRGRDQIILHLPEHWPWYDAWDGLFNATHRTTHRAPPARVA